MHILGDVRLFLKNGDQHWLEGHPVNFLLIGPQRLYSHLLEGVHYHLWLPFPLVIADIGPFSKTPWATNTGLDTDSEGVPKQCSVMYCAIFSLGPQTMLINLIT